jgi:hypothetical protein
MCAGTVVSGCYRDARTNLVVAAHTVRRLGLIRGEWIAIVADLERRCMPLALRRAYAMPTPWSGQIASSRCCTSSVLSPRRGRCATGERRWRNALQPAAQTHRAAQLAKLLCQDHDHAGGKRRSLLVVCPHRPATAAGERWRQAANPASGQSADTRSKGT